MQSQRLRAGFGLTLAVLLAGGLTACSGNGGRSGLGNAPGGGSATSTKSGGNDGGNSPGSDNPGGGNTDGTSPAKLKVDATSLNLGTNGTKLVTVRNTGQLALEWTSRTGVSWLVLSPNRGSLAGGKSQTVRISLRRAPEGKLKGTATISSNGGATTLAVTAAADYAPTISNARLVNATTGARLTRLCAGTLVQIVADVTDGYGLASVQSNFTWYEGTIEDGGGSGLADMQHGSGSTYRSATMAARSDGRYNFLVRATDTTGHIRTNIAKVTKFTLPGCGTIGAFSS